MKILNCIVSLGLCAVLSSGCSLPAKKTAEKFEGSIITFRADTEGRAPSKEEMKTVETIFNTRLSNAGYTEASVETSASDEITVRLPLEVEPDRISSLLSSSARLTFCDADGNIVIDNSDIESAEYQYGKLSEDGESTHYVMVIFTSDGRTKFSEATKNAAARAEEGKNYISIQLDNTEISNPRVSEEIDSDSCIISGNFTAETAAALAAQINSGNLPFKMYVSGKQVIYPE